jgi:Flp pilus assembly protein TadG
MSDQQRSALLRRFIRNRRATTSIEFGLLAAPFLALSFAILQTAVMFFAGQALETAAATSARLILTGQAQTQGWNAAQFKQQVCATITGLFNCQSGVYIDVENYATFADANLSPPVTNGNLNTSAMNYNPGGAGNVVMVRLYYPYPVFMNFLSNLSGGFNLLAATAIFKNEPYASS